LASTKTSAPLTPAIAAQQSYWLCRQAAGHFHNSERGRNATSRASARRRFIEDARLALPTMGLEKFLANFERHSSGDVREAEPIIRELWAELQIKSAIAGQPGPVTPAPIGSADAVRQAVANAQQLMAIAQQQMDLAVRLIDEADKTTATTGEIETRESK